MLIRIAVLAVRNIFVIFAPIFIAILQLTFISRQYEYSSARFKARSEKETYEAENRCKLAEERAREAESDARNQERRLGDGGTKEERMELRIAQRHAIECRRDCEVLKKLAERKRK